jgi:molybdopterin-guanine dinucleotide biosynthesis protein A
MSVSPDAVGFVLAGGRSSRMGSEKALIQLAGEPLVVHAIRILRKAGLAARIAGARSPLDRYALVVPDTEPDRGPVGGICTALAFTAAKRAVFLPVDMPLLPAALVLLLLETAQSEDSIVTVPALGGFVQTFPAVVDRAALPWLRAALENGRAGCFQAFQAAAAGVGQTVGVLAVEDAAKQSKLAEVPALPINDWFMNVNEPADLARAEAFLANGYA